MFDKAVINLKANLQTLTIVTPKSISLGILESFLDSIKIFCDMILDDINNPKISGTGMDIYYLTKEKNLAILSSELYDKYIDDIYVELDYNKCFITNIEDMIRIIKEWDEILKSPGEKQVIIYQETKDSPVKFKVEQIEN